MAFSPVRMKVTGSPLQTTLSTGIDCTVPLYFGFTPSAMAKSSPAAAMSRGSTFTQPSVTAYVTSKQSLLFVKSVATSPIAVVPASVRVASAVPPNTVSAEMSYNSSSVATSYPSTLFSLPSYVNVSVLPLTSTVTGRFVTVSVPGNHSTV